MNTDDDAPTPQVKPTPSYLRPLQATDTDDPEVYLVQDPTEDERTLGKQVGLYNGAAVPWWMFAKLTRRVERYASGLRDVAIWAGGQKSFLRKMRRRAWGGAAALAANLALVSGYVYHRAEASGAADERAVQVQQRELEYRDSVRREMDSLHREIDQLRALLFRLTGAKPDIAAAPRVAIGPHPTPSIDQPLPFDLVLPIPDPQPRGCGAGCTTSRQCDQLSNCHYCGNFQCTAILPAEPKGSPP